MTHLRDPGEFILLAELAAQVDARTRFNLRVAFVIESERVEMEFQMEIGVEEPWILIKDFSFVTAPGILERRGERAAIAEEIAIAEGHADKPGRVVQVQLE